MDSATNEVRLKVGDAVEVGPLNITGHPHPHAGRKGRISEFFTYANPITAMICLNDGGEDDGHFIIVSLQCLKRLA